jgi:hypothetical protein
MRRSIVAAAALFALAAMSVAPPSSAQDDELKPVMQLPQIRYDFGKTFEKEKFEHDFVVRNTGKADLIIDRVKPG